MGLASALEAADRRAGTHPGTNPVANRQPRPIVIAWDHHLDRWR
jgi:hypothetical protein